MQLVRAKQVLGKILHHVVAFGLAVHDDVQADLLLQVDPVDVQVTWIDQRLEPHARVAGIGVQREPDRRLLPR